MKSHVVIYRVERDSVPVVEWFDCGEMALAAWLRAKQLVDLGRWHCALSASADGEVNDRANLHPHAAAALVRAALAEQFASTP